MTDRALRTSADLDRLDFSKGDGLVTIVAQHDVTGEVLMVGYADREALEATVASGRLHFRSRSRGVLWMKGETSGNTLTVVGLRADCDGDAVLARVSPAGPTCHTGAWSCFDAAEGTAGADPTQTSAAQTVSPSTPNVLERLDRTLVARERERPEGSHTVRLLDDANLRLKKLGEESAELVAALAGGERERSVAEAADLIYHVLVALRAEGVGVDAVLAELDRRS